MHGATVQDRKHERHPYGRSLPARDRAHHRWHKPDRSLQHASKGLSSVIRSIGPDWRLEVIAAALERGEDPSAALALRLEGGAA